MCVCVCLCVCVSVWIWALSTHRSHNEENKRLFSECANLSSSSSSLSSVISSLLCSSERLLSIHSWGWNCTKVDGNNLEFCVFVYCTLTPASRVSSSFRVDVFHVHGSSDICVLTSPTSSHSPAWESPAVFSHALTRTLQSFYQRLSEGTPENVSSTCVLTPLDNFRLSLWVKCRFESSSDARLVHLKSSAESRASCRTHGSRLASNTEAQWLTGCLPLIVITKQMIRVTWRKRDLPPDICSCTVNPAFRFKSLPSLFATGRVRLIRKQLNCWNIYELLRVR